MLEHKESLVFRSNSIPGFIRPLSICAMLDCVRLPVPGCDVTTSVQAKVNGDGVNGVNSSPLDRSRSQLRIEVLRKGRSSMAPLRFFLQMLSIYFGLSAGYDVTTAKPEVGQSLSWHLTSSVGTRNGITATSQRPLVFRNASPVFPRSKSRRSMISNIERRTSLTNVNMEFSAKGL